MVIVEEITERKQAEWACVYSLEILEQRVAERTEQLTTSNVELRREIEERKRAQQDLRGNEVYRAEAQRLSHAGSGAWKVQIGEVFWSYAE